MRCRRRPPRRRRLHAAALTPEGVLLDAEAQPDRRRRRLAWSARRRHHRTGSSRDTAHKAVADTGPRGGGRWSTWSELRQTFRYTSGQFATRSGEHFTCRPGHAVIGTATAITGRTQTAYASIGSESNRAVVPIRRTARSQIRRSINRWRRERRITIASGPRAGARFGAARTARYEVQDGLSTRARGVEPRSRPAGDGDRRVYSPRRRGVAIRRPEPGLWVHRRRRTHTDAERSTSARRAVPSDGTRRLSVAGARCSRASKAPPR